MNVTKHHIMTLTAGWLFLVSCASNPKPDTENFSGDLTTDIDGLQKDLDQRYANQVNVLAPVSYRAAKKELEEAKSARDHNKSEHKIREHAGLAKAWIKKADETSEKTSKEFSEILESRAYALKAGATEHANKELSKADDAFESYTRDFEKGGKGKIALEDHKKLLTLYQDTAKEALKSKHLSSARSAYSQSVKEGAKTLIPGTANSVEKKIRESEVFVEANYRDETQVASQAAQAQASADRLLQLTREAKENKGKSVEELTLESEQKENKLAAAESTAKQVEQKANATAKQLSERERYDRAYEVARQTFTEEEAEVLREGDNVILRLKGLKFKNGKSELSGRDIALLSKVTTVLSAYEPGTIVVQGHTDTTGSKKANKNLSENRAEVVKTYLQGIVPSEQQVNIEATGAGSEKPVANNKTAEGRAQNRRVDLILSSRKEDPAAKSF